MTAAFRPGPVPTAFRLPGGALRVVAVLAAATGLSALLPGRGLAVCAAACALALAVHAIRAGIPDRLRTLALLLALPVLVANVAELVPPVPSPTAVLATAAASLGARWNDLLGQLSDVVRDPPPAGSDFGWIAKRAAPLGDRAGLALLGPDATHVVAWAGWTTPLAAKEREELLARIDRGPVLLVLRRGLTLRLLYARREPGAEHLIVAAERPLPPEPDPGTLGEGLDPSVHILVRWEALGEGLRAPVDNDDAAGPATYWSLVPLMAGPNDPAARVSLGVVKREALVAHADARRRAAGAAAVALVLVLVPLLGWRPAWLPLAGARLALLTACPTLDAWSAPLGAVPWQRLVGEDPGLPGRLVHTPLDAALTGLAVLVAAALAMRSESGAGRAVRAVGGLVLAAAGLAVLARVAVVTGTLPAEAIIPGADWGGTLLAVIAIGALPVAGTILATRALFPSARLAVLWGALAGGALAGAVQGAAIGAAARYSAEHEVAPQVADRRQQWAAALRETLSLAAPPTGPEQLVPERDAIDLWWNSPLGQQGLAAGIWKFGPGDEPGTWRLEDRFLTGLPPVQPTPGMAGLPAGSRDGGPSVIGPVRRQLQFLGSSYELLIAEVARPEGGAWIAAVLDEPRNIPGETGDDWSRAIRAGPAARERRSPFLTAHLAWFDQAGRLLGSDLESAPPAPRSQTERPHWRNASIEGRPAQILRLPDADGTVSLVYFSPGLFARAALVIDRAGLFGLLVLLVGAIAALVGAPRAAVLAVRLWIRRLGTHFRVQVPVSLVAAGLLPLAALAIAGRAVTERMTALQLLDEGATVTHNAANMVRDFVTLAPGGPVRLGDFEATWVARSIGNDLFVWERGDLLATNRPDLVRAGFWPERLAGGTWAAMTTGRVPLLVDPAVRSDDPARRLPAVAQSPFQTPDGHTGVLTVPLARAGRRIEENRLTVDRALLVSAALLVGLAGLLVGRATRRLVRPLAALERETSRIAGGDFTTPIQETGYEETRGLARAFQSMATSLAEQRARLEERGAAIETLIARMPVAVIAVGPDEMVSAANPRAAELLGVVAGKPLPRNDDPLCAAVRRLAAGHDEGADAVDRVEQGRTRNFRAAGIDLPGLVEGASARLVVVEDLTDAVRSERLSAWAEMARRIAHEIKNPLTPISLVVEHVRQLIAEGHPDLPAALDRALRTIAEQVRVLKETSREFSDYARILVARPEPLDVPRLLADWLAPYTLAPPAGIVVRLLGPSELPPLSADPRLIRRAVVNLVDNAMAAVHDGGTVTVRWERAESPEPALLVSVTDDGPGIEPERLGRIFDTGETTRETGSGLGLPIALQAALAHGGRIDVTTAPGAGARFTIVLPYSPATRPMAERAGMREQRS